MSAFTEQDLQQLDEFGQMISSKAQFQLSAAEAVKLVKYLNFVNSLRKKISDNILEYRRIIEQDNNAEKSE